MDVIREPRFWYAYLRGAFGQRGPEFDPDVLSACLGVDEEAAREWWNAFTGWYEGVLEETDGEVDQPGLLEVPLAGEDVLVVEAHPGDTYVRRRRPRVEPVDTIASFGPHWWLPDWTLVAVQRVAGGSPFAFMVLSPLARLGVAEDRAAAEEVFSAAWIQSGVLDAPSARRLAREWSRCATVEK